MTPGIGHNQGPTMEPGGAWRRYCWTKARADLLPVLPLPVVRIRMRRARELGLDYPTYATVRATTGRDIIGFLFSSNALDLRRSARDLPEDRAAKLAAQIDCRRLLAAHRPLEAAQLVEEIETARGIAFAHAFPAPLFTESWSAARDRMAAAFAESRLPPAAVLMVGATGMERTWSEAARMAGYLDAGRYFG